MQSAKDLDVIFHGMSITFDGRETEFNWKQRDNHLLELCKICEGTAPKEQHHAFVGGVRAILDGIIASLISERTTLSNHAAAFVQVLAKTIGSSIHPMLDLLLPATIKLCAFTKPISSRAGNETMRDILAGSKSYTPRLLHHVTSAFTSETASPRIYAPVWLESLLKMYASQIDHAGGARQVEEAVRRGLNDANAKARENSRPLYWAFAKQWPSRAEPIMAALEPQRQKALQDDPNNPNKPAKADKYPRPASSLAEAKAQAKKQLQAKRSASDQDGLPFVIVPDVEKAQPKASSQHHLDRKKAPIRPRHDAQQQSVSHPTALQPLSNPSSSGSGNSRPDTGHGSSHSKTGSTDSVKSQESLAAQRSRPLMAAPVRRAVRVVSNTTPAPAVRPSSREGQAREAPQQLREAKLPIRPTSADTPVSRNISRSPAFEEASKVEAHARTRSKHEPKVDAHAETPASQPVIEPIARPLEDHRRKPTQSKEIPAAQASAKLQHAMKKIRNFDLAPLGLTKVRRLVESSSDVLFTTKQPFDDVMSTMFYAADNIDKMVAKHLQEQPEDAFVSIQQNRNTRRSPSAGEGLAREYRFSIISMLQSMLYINSVFFAPFQAQAMRLLLLSRSFVEDKDHKVKDLEDMTWNIVVRCDQSLLLRTVFLVLDNLDVVENNKSALVDSSSTIVMSLQTLSLLFVSAQENDSNAVKLGPWLEKGAQVAGHFCLTGTPRVRKASVDLSVVLQKVMGEQNFDKAFSGDEGIKNMVTYYANKLNATNGESRSIPGLVGWGERE